jgi:hypothetical protein
MIDNTLARMIDETLRETAEIDGIWPRKMLEVPVNQAHLQGLVAAFASLLKCREFRS